MQYSMFVKIGMLLELQLCHGIVFDVEGRQTVAALHEKLLRQRHVHVAYTRRHYDSTTLSGICTAVTDH